MRATVEFEADTATAIEKLRSETGADLNEIVNDLIRLGLDSSTQAGPYVPIRRDLGLSIDVSNISDTLDLLDGDDVR